MGSHRSGMGVASDFCNGSDCGLLGKGRAVKTKPILVTVMILRLGGPVNTGYALVVLGTLPDQNHSSAHSIDNYGQIVGYSMHGWEAVLFDTTGNGNNVRLGMLATGDPTYNSVAYSINNNGQIVGEADAGGADYATLFDPTGNGNNINLGALGAQPGAGSDLGVAHSINDSGQIVGWASTENSPHPAHATLFDSTGNGSNIDLGTLGGTRSGAYANNNDGDIVGFAWTPSSDSHATLFDPTGGENNIDLGTFGGDYSTARAINNHGQIVGWAADSSGNSHATIFDPTGNGDNIDLGMLDGESSAAYAINNGGQIVGTATDSWGNTRATLFDPTGSGENIDLNDLIRPSASLELIRASDINDSGWIVGRGLYPNGYEGAFLLIPGPALIGDCDLSGYVDDDDLSILLANWTLYGDWTTGDLDEYWFVADNDLSLILAHWNEGTPPLDGSAVPEPATLSLLALGACLIRRKR